MLFNSFRFLIFFPVVCIIYYIIPYKFRHVFLLVASYYFYMCWNVKYAFLMLLSTIITYLSGIFIDKANKISQEEKKQICRKLCVFISFSTNLAILFFFKYFNFLITSLNKLLGYIDVSLLDVNFDVVLPVGISFYTFQALSYTVDVYRGEIYTEKNFLKYALFVSFFPQLVAGPIERSKNLLRQINVKHNFDLHRVHTGLILMLYGLFQKMVLSDNISLIVTEVYDNYNDYGSVELVFATVLFAFQIYCDFGGYSNIAIGAARVMGFDLMENFNTPYMADTVANFWRRWHISLTTWFRDYLYIPLGGNRKGRVRKYLNIMIVFLTSGLWHGASWHFVAWGGINGLYQIVGDILKPIRDKLTEIFIIDRKVMSHKILKVVTTFIFVDISWIFFRADSISDAFAIVNGICTRIHLGVLINGSLMQIGIDKKQFIILLAALIILISIDVCKYMKVNLIERLCEQGAWFQYIVYLFLIYSILIFGNYGPTYDASQFIYFQF